MKVVIEVSEKDYQNFLLQYDNGILDEKTPSHRAKIAIARGIPLPKGHGRLIDADKLIDDFKNSRAMTFEERMKASNIVQHAYDKLCVIEADKEGAKG